MQKTPESVKNGSMRPLRDPNELDELEYSLS